VVHFLLWGNGGPNYVREFRLWEVEEEKTWQTVGRKTYVDAIQQPLSGANRIPLGRQTPQRKVPAPPPRLTFLNRLSAKEIGFLESAISAGHGLEQILQAFRFGDDGSHVNSFLDSLSTLQIQELRSFIATKTSMETLARTFYGEKSAAQFSPNLVETVFPAASDFQQVTSAVTPAVTGAGAEPFIQNSDPRTSVFQRLEPAQAQQRVSAFDRLVYPAPPPNSRQQPAQQMGRRQPRQGPTCPRCLRPGHPRINCWNKIRCHGCDKPGHIKKDCRALKETWVHKEINLSPPDVLGKENQALNDTTLSINQGRSGPSEVDTVL
jgi:hypothetical protein